MTTVVAVPMSKDSPVVSLKNVTDVMSVGGFVRVSVLNPSNSRTPTEDTTIVSLSVTNPDDTLAYGQAYIFPSSSKALPLAPS